MALTPARRAAFETLQAVARGRRLDLSFAESVRGLSGADRRWVHELTYGTVRLRGRLDHLLQRHVHRGLDRVDASVVDVLRLGAYQILRMRSVPTYAAVSQSVDQAREVGGGGAASMANAVLRRVGESGEDPAIFPPPDTDPEGYLSTWGSHPAWMVRRWLARWPFADVAALIAANNEPPPLTFVPFELSPAEAVERLAAAGVEAREVGRSTGAVEVTGDASPSDVLRLITAAVQDPGAALVGVYADPPSGVVAADLCAAPGGKTLALARRALYVLAADRSLVRLRLVRENLERTGLRAGLVVADAATPPLRGADFVLLDVPCTGTGTLRRHPDARWRLAEEDVPRLAKVQARMLDAAAPLVPQGGLVVYSTCTLEPEENEEQVSRFLAVHTQFRVEPTHAVDAAFLDDEGRLCVLPQRSGFDGAFAVRLRRVGRDGWSGSRWTPSERRIDAAGQFDTKATGKGPG